METEKRLRFNYDTMTDQFQVINDNGEIIGYIRKERVGTYMHWCFVYDLTLFENLPKSSYFRVSPGCQDEIREFSRNPEKYAEKFPETIL